MDPRLGACWALTPAPAHGHPSASGPSGFWLRACWEWTHRASVLWRAAHLTFSTTCSAFLPVVAPDGISLLPEAGLHPTVWVDVFGLSVHLRMDVWAAASSWLS